MYLVSHGCAAIALVAAGTASACDLDLDTRGGTAAAYVPQARACLVAPPDGYVFDTAQETWVFDLVNEARTSAGLPALKLRPELIAAARYHSLDMAANGHFGHVGPDGRQPADRIALLDRRLVQAASRENLASIQGGFDKDEAGRILHEQLMNSPTHFANIMAEDVDHLAIGLVATRNGAWVTQLFVKEIGELSEEAPTEVRAGEPFTLSARLDGWRFERFQLGMGDDALEFERSRRRGEATVPEAPGEHRLNVKGRRRAEQALAYYTIQLGGPAVTVVR